MKKILKLSFLIFFILTGFLTKALANLDSLWSVWNDESKSDSIRAVAYKNYIWKGFLFSQPDSAFILAEELLAFGHDKNYLNALALSYNAQGVSWYVRGDYAKALHYYSKSLEVEKQTGNKKGIAICLNNIGLIYVNKGNYPKALEYYTQGLKIEEQIGNQKGVSSSLNNIGIIYNNQGDYIKALDYYNQSLNIDKQIGDQKGISSSLNNIGIIYEYLGDYPKALDYHTQSLKIKEQIGDQMGIAPSLHNIGIVYERMGDYPKALDYYNQSIKIKEQIGDQRGIAQSLNNIGIVYQNQGDYSQALYYCQKAYELALKIGALELQKTGCKCLYDTYKAKGNRAKALEYHERIKLLDDSLQSIETVRMLQQMEFKRQVQADSLIREKERLKIQIAHEKEVGKKKRTRNIFLATALLFLILAIGFYRRILFVRKAKGAIEYEKDRSDKLLLNILPSEVADELKEKGRANARKYDIVSILFTDFKGFTHISEKLGAEELVQEINTCFKAFDAICQKYAIEKIKTIGDAYMAVGGLPVPLDDSVKNTVLAAIQMAEFMTNRKSELEKEGSNFFEMRLGIHTGSVVAGIVGEIKFQYDIWGDAVNIASCMENSGQVGKVNISKSTFELIKEDSTFKFLSRGKIKTKDKGDIEMWFVEKI